jgi:spermidine synthase
MAYGLLFLEGFIGLSFQLLFFRQLSPEIGSASVTDGWIIGIFLGAMSLGYKTGGNYHPKPLEKFGRNLLLSSVIGGIFASSFFLTNYFSILSNITFFSDRLSILILYCIFAIGPVAYLMGQSLPLLIQVSKLGSNPSQIGGNALFLSTIGSMFGSIIPMALLAPLIGATQTLAVIVVIAATFGIGLSKGKVKIFSYTLAGIFSVTIVLLPSFFLKKGQFTSTAYSDIYLVEKKHEKLMVANGIIMSAQDHLGKNSSQFLTVFSDEIKRNGIVNKNILILGAGGFMAHVDDTDNNHFTYVDIDKELKEWSETHFHKNLTDIEFIARDARAFLMSKNDRKWSVIYIDTYTSRYDMPEHLMTVEFYKLVKSKLAHDGVVMFNAILHTFFKDKFSQKFDVTVKSVFPYCHVIPSESVGSYSNVHYTCFNRNEQHPVYADDLHSISQDVWDASVY